MDHASRPTRRRLAGLTLACLAVTLIPAGPAAAGKVAHLVFDPADTTLSFSVDSIGYPRTEGRFRAFSGRADVDFDVPSKSTVDFEADSGSTDAGLDVMNGVLQGAGFLDAAHFRTIHFKSTAVEKTAEDSVLVTGDLTMLGITRPLAVTVHVDRGDGNPKHRLAFKVAASIDRLAYGMDAAYPMVSKTVDIAIESEAVPR